MKLFFDLLIFIGVTMTALPAVILFYHRKKDKESWERQRPRLSLAMIIALTIGAVTLIYGSFIEPRMLITNEQIIDLPNIKEPIRIAFFADPQVGPYRRADNMEKIVERILRLAPDITLIGGDLVDNGIPRRDETVYLEPLKKLAARMPTFAVHGNHEYGVSYAGDKNGVVEFLPDVSQEVKTAVEKLGVDYLVNDLRLVQIRGEKFYLFGGDSWWTEKLDFSVLENRNISGLATIALIHNPAAAWEASKQNLDLLLAGHTHGGQIRLPLIGPLALVDNIIPKKWYQGLNLVGKMRLFVTSGTGETGVRARLFNPPEVVLLTIK